MKGERWEIFDKIVANNLHVINNLRDDFDGGTLLMWVGHDMIKFHHVLRYQPDVSVIDKFEQNIFHVIALDDNDDDAIEMLNLIDNELNDIKWDVVLN